MQKHEKRQEATQAVNRIEPAQMQMRDLLAGQDKGDEYRKRSYQDYVCRVKRTHG
jgi:hypothetical protein